MQQSTVTESIYIIRMMLRAGTAAGVDSDYARTCIHLDQETLDDPDARVPLKMEQNLWNLLAQRSGDPFFGLHAGTSLIPGEFDVMDYAIRTSKTLREALENAHRYNRLLHDVAEFELSVNDRVACFDHYFRNDPNGASWQAADFSLASVYTVGVAITGKHWIPRKVSFQHPAPDDLSPYKQIFQCDLAFGCARNRIEFNAAVLDYPVLGSDPSLHQVLARHADELLAKLPAVDSIVDQVRSQISLAMRSGEPTIEGIAAGLHMTARTLQRRLKESATSYKEVVDTLRKATAERYLEESHLGVSEIAYLLGYSEPSAFHRAFKRWFGQAPAEYRLRLNT